MTIKTDCIHPPIPTRCFDWSAIDADTYDGAPDSPNRNQIGYGATENDAVEDLKAQLIPETFMTTELGRLVNDLVNAARKVGTGEYDHATAWADMIATEKALLEYVATLEAVRYRVEWLAKKWEQEGTATPFLREELRRASHGLR